MLSVLGTHVFGSPWDKLLIIAVLTSASASTQTTILPTARTTLSMARWKAIPPIFGRIHPKYLTPDVSTLDAAEKSAIVRALEKHQGNVSRAAQALGVTRATLYRRKEKYGL